MYCTLLDTPSTLNVGKDSHHLEVHYRSVWSSTFRLAVQSTLLRSGRHNLSLRRDMWRFPSRLATDTELTCWTPCWTPACWTRRPHQCMRIASNVISRKIIILEFVVSPLTLNRRASAYLVQWPVFFVQRNGWKSSEVGCSTPQIHFLTMTLSSVPELWISLSESNLHLACWSSSSTCGNLPVIGARTKAIQPQFPHGHGRSWVSHVY